MLLYRVVRFALIYMIHSLEKFIQIQWAPVFILGKVDCDWGSVYAPTLQFRTRFDLGTALSGRR